MAGSLRTAARPAVIAAELAGQRLLDRLRPADRDGTLAARLTVVVKTFERPRLLDRLLASLRRRHPLLPVIVVDDSRDPIPRPGVETVVLPFDQGVSAGKQAGLDRVGTELVTFLDDDFVATRHTDFGRAVAALDAHPVIDLVGGQVRHLPRFRADDYRRSGVFPTTALPILPPGSEVGGLPVMDKVANFFVARTDRLRLVGWDPRIKRIDHTDFFTRARGVLTTVYDAELQILHAQDWSATAYLERRADQGGDQRVITERWFST
jgi:glycosyltransferase involved in cell wall biosynthesis